PPPPPPPFFNDTATTEIYTTTESAAASDVNKTQIVDHIFVPQQASSAAADVPQRDSADAQ
ncbi:hypothetical protein, partial [Klebsiella pneumoniae]|uniref:hypothetical protein n=1 Tax=Klebsiella pneumoniae TaxID=573 RepID=UPI003B27F3B2